MTDLDYTPRVLTGSSVPADGTKTIGPFHPHRGVPATLTAEGTGTVQLLRSVDGGTTKKAVTLAGSVAGKYTLSAGIINEPVWEEYEDGAALYVTLSGTISVRLAQ